MNLTFEDFLLDQYTAFSGAKQHPFPFCHDHAKSLPKQRSVATPIIYMLGHMRAAVTISLKTTTDLINTVMGFPLL